MLPTIKKKLVKLLKTDQIINLLSVNAALGDLKSKFDRKRTILKYMNRDTKNKPLYNEKLFFV